MAHIFTPALRRPLSKPFAKSGTRTLIQRAIASLRARGTDAHLWLPGVGTINGLTTGNYLESTGNTLGTVDNPVGLVLDALGTVGEELVANWTTWTGATAGGILSNAGGVISITTTTAGTADGYFKTVSGLTIGATYKTTIDVASGAIRGIHNSPPYTPIPTTSVQVSLFWEATTTSIDIYVYNNSLSIGNTAVVSGFSVKKVSGIHLTQGTTANKPLLRRGLTNLLTYSSDFSNAAWITEGTASKVGNVLNMPASHGDNAYHGALLPAGTYTNAFVLSGSGTISLFCYNPTDNIFAVKQITLTATPTIYVNVASPTVANNIYYFGRRAGDTATSVTFGCGGLFQGTLTASQILAAGGIPVTTTAAASNPNAGKYSWAFDGSNDKLDMGSLPFGLADDHAFIVGAQSGQVGTSIALCGLYSSVANNPRLQMYIGSANNLSMQYRSDGGTSVAPALSPALANFTPFVGSMRKIGASATLRQNGSLSSTVSVATVDVVTADRAVIGETKGSYMNGPIGPVLAIKGTVTDAELLMYERLVAALTPGAPSF